MRLLASFLIPFLAVASAAPRFTFHVAADDPGAWPTILSSVGFISGPEDGAGIVIVPHGTTPAGSWEARVEQGTILILEGESPAASAFGFRVSVQPHVQARSMEDLRSPELGIVWERTVDLPVFEFPANAHIFAREKWKKAPVMAGFRKGAGAVLWIAAPPGDRGFERFPYFFQALADLGLEPPFRSERLWAFFDSAYRSRVDLDYFAARWRAAGISALQVAAWHYWEPDPESDAYLRTLIDACHRHAILVYGWFELPHVSDKFWDQHPEWREKTALGQDAQLDWRKLMNLTNRSASAAIAEGVRDLVTRFDWDGVNLAELYFESLEGHDNPARFTPMNADVRAEFQRSAGFDPMELFDPQSPHAWTRSSAGMAKFLDFRAELARRQQAEWIGEAEKIRREKPYLDLVLTHIDDRFDTSMREKLGADTSKVLPMLGEHDFTFLVEDPATIWNLGPERYSQIASRYAPLTPFREKLGVDINVVERYQDVYPTKQQTGTELFELVHAAAGAFPRVALYFENSIGKVDLPWLPSAAAAVTKAEQAGGKTVVEARRPIGIPWAGPAIVNGKLWPVASDSTLWLPAGAHAIEPAAKPAPLRLLDFSGDLKSASAAPDGIEFSYQSPARALAVLDRVPGGMQIDGAATKPEFVHGVLILPRGQHLVTIRSGPSTQSGQ